MHPILIVGYVKEEGVEYILKSGQIVVGRLDDDRLESSGRSGKEGSDFLRSHSRLVVLRTVYCNEQSILGNAPDMRSYNSSNGLGVRDGYVVIVTQVWGRCWYPVRISGGAGATGGGADEAEDDDAGDGGNNGPDDAANDDADVGDDGDADDDDAGVGDDGGANEPVDGDGGMRSSVR